jgi:hypothetical protein
MMASQKNEYLKAENDGANSCHRNEEGRTEKIWKSIDSVA